MTAPRVCCQASTPMAATIAAPASGATTLGSIPRPRVVPSRCLSAEYGEPEVYGGPIRLILKANCRTMAVLRRPRRRSWAAEFGASGVRVNAVSPGTTRTPAVEIMGEALDQLVAQPPLGYVARPEQIADTIVHLATDEAGYITGTLLDVDGGRTAV
ncbi:SDR family oxidoreductase [Streptomyces aurantiacus]|uniref:SDR family oxidoreductase n=1 Tax=Streptomyces aurantiacus TaxID=47760 RepID=UPI0027D7F913|nr:SDR family oxidoreductase [Streptomyces aurantiacus]